LRLRRGRNFQVCTLKTEQYESKSNIIEDKNLLFRF